VKNVKKTNMKLYIYVYIIIVILLAGAITAATRVSIERADSEATTTESSKLDGIKYIIKEMSVLTEEKRCKEWGGKFYVYIFSPDKWKPELGKLSVSCKKSYTEGNKEINETLFENEIDFTRTVVRFQ
jgi:hypothetical protein